MILIRLALSLFFLLNLPTLASELKCTALKSHSYNSEDNTLIVGLGKALPTIEGKKVEKISVLSTADKIKVKMASTRKGARLCFQNLSFKNNYHYAMAEKIILIQREDVFGLASHRL